MHVPRTAATIVIAFGLGVVVTLAVVFGTGGVYEYRIELPHQRWAPWAAAEERYLVASLGVWPTAQIAATLGRGEGAIRRRARRLGRRVGDAHGWPLQRVARIARVSEHVLRGYIDSGELPIFKGAKHVYVDVGDLLVVEEIDWRQAPAVLEA